MKYLKVFFHGLLLTLCFLACSKDEGFVNTDINSSNNSNEKAELSIHVTDAPIDNSEVEACFVTIAGIYLDGVKVEAFSETTVDLLAYQNSDTYKLGDFEVDSRNYSSIELELMAESPDEATHPHGSYILDSEGKAHALINNSVFVSLSSEFEADASTKTEIVLDFDLRKCVKEQDDENDKYDFVSNSKLNGAIRVSALSDTHILGECSSLLKYSDEVIVYIYNKGEFNAENEIQTESETKLQFRNAVSSSKLNGQKKFQLSFLKEGDYELHFYGYDFDQEGQLQLKGKLEVESLTTLLNLVDINVTAQSNIELSLMIVGMQ
ncbi:MAG: DUF4382 domain-containing protein [Bacteroidia bacterium]|nr:DUF4382 domain-containing protein [Bacteroidia bacterium]